jgi:hypothetical protein
MLSAARISGLLEALNAELAIDDVRGEIYLAGGAVMCLVFHSREATKDIDALLVPADALRKAAEIVGNREGLPPGWLNDAVKGFFSESGRFGIFTELSHLKVFAPHPEYLLAHEVPRDAAGRGVSGSLGCGRTGGRGWTSAD